MFYLPTSAVVTYPIVSSAMKTADRVPVCARGREDRLWTWLAQLRQTPAHEWNRFYASSAALLLPQLNFENNADEHAMIASASSELLYQVATAPASPTTDSYTLPLHDPRPIS